LILATVIRGLSEKQVCNCPFASYCTLATPVPKNPRIKVSTVAVSGHSLGAALSIITSVYLNQHLNNVTVGGANAIGNIKINTVVFGSPRSGNQEWANFVDANVSLSELSPSPSCRAPS
jgi:hypothetical protein